MFGDFYLFTRICRKFLMKKVSLIKFKQIWAERRQILVEKITFTYFIFESEFYNHALRVTYQH